MNLKKIICPICKRKYFLTDVWVEKGFYDKGDLLACYSCFKKLQREFWKKKILKELEEGK